MSSKQHLNHVAIKRENTWYIFERMGKQVPFGIYPLHRHLGNGMTVESAIENSSVPTWDIEVISDE